MDKDTLQRIGLILVLAVASSGVIAQTSDEESVTYYRKSDKPPQKCTPESEELLQQARQLYKKGPSKAQDVVDLLQEAIAADKTCANTYYLLGLTYYGTGRLKEALVEFERALELKEADGKTIQPALRFHRARTLFYLGKCAEARQILESHWAFWQDGGSLQERYEALYPEVERSCGEHGVADSD